MNRVWIAILLVVFALLAYVGLEKLAKKGVEHYAGQKMDDLQAEAAKKYPNLPLSDAVKKVGEERASAMLSAESNPEQKNLRAAQMFYGYYFLNTKIRVEYCNSRGADISPFVNRFQANNRAEAARAQAIFAKANTQPEDMLAMIRPALAKAVEQDMKDVSAGAGVPVDKACALFNEHAVTLADYIKLPGDVRAALMAD